MKSKLPIIIGVLVLVGSIVGIVTYQQEWCIIPAFLSLAFLNPAQAESVEDEQYWD